jgi:hypothetical protein
MSQKLTENSPFSRRMNAVSDLHNTKYHLADGLSLLARSKKLGKKDKAKIIEFLDHLSQGGERWPSREIRVYDQDLWGRPRGSDGKS